MTDPTRSLPAPDATPASDTELALDLAAEYQVAVAEGRPADLAAICKDRPDLIPQVQALLSVGAKLDEAAGAEAKAARASADEQALPDAVGRYVVVGPVGRGGMGVVYRAVDPVFGREVAVKVLQERNGPDSGAARRFADEARITAQLQHPAIPAVHDLGTLPDGRPFLAMKLIKGDTLDELLKARPDPSAERGRFVAVFEAICQGVAYAHSRGVLHRDLKPANVMVGAFGEVQVMDWGLAKVLGTNSRVGAASPDETAAGTAIRSLRDSDGSFTHAGSVLGTPAFMPPEQAIGAVDRIDARSDVFGLGGLLCAILTGKPPFVGTNAETTRQLAALGKVADAFARLDASGAEPDLVALCKRCLAPDPTDRPADAAEVATAVADLRAAAAERARVAELDKVKVEGEKLAAELQTREQRKRRRVQLALAGAVAMLLISGVVFTAWRGRQLRAKEVADAQAEGERLRLDGDRRAAEARADAELAFKEQQARKGIDGNLILAADLRSQYRFRQAEAALAQAAELALGGAPERLKEVDQAKRDLAFVVQLDDIRCGKWVWLPSHGGKGKFNTQIAPAKYRAAFATYGWDLARLDPGTAANLIGTSPIKAEVIAAIDDWAVYETEESLERRLLDVARRADPGPWKDRFRDIAVRRNVEAALVLAGDADPRILPPAVLSSYASLLSRLKVNPMGILELARRDYPSDFELAFRLGNHQTEAHRHTAAIATYEAARALRPDNRSVWLNLGNALLNTGDAAGAVEAYERGVRMAPNAAEAHTNLGIALLRVGDMDRAIASLKRAIELDPKDIVAHGNLGNAWLKKGETDEALSAFRAAIAADRNSSMAHYSLGLALDRSGDVAGAIAAYRKAVELDPKYLDAHANLGELLLRRGDLDGAATALRQAIASFPHSTELHYQLGIVLTQANDPKGAIDAYKRASELDPKDPKPLVNMGILQLRAGDPKAAVIAHTRAIALDPKDARAFLNLGNALQDLGDVTGAVEAHQQALKLDPTWAAPHVNLGSIYLDQRKTHDAITSARAAIKIDQQLSSAHVVLGLALRQAGDLRGARAALTEATRLDNRWAVELAKLPLVEVAPVPRLVK